MNVDSLVYKLIGQRGDFLVGNEEAHVTVFRPEWIVEPGASNVPMMPSLRVGSRILQPEPGGFEYQFAANRWHKKNYEALHEVCVEGLSLSPDEFEYTVLSGYEFALLFRNQYTGLQFKIFIGT